jgi:hypothetical protein
MGIITTEGSDTGDWRLETEAVEEPVAVGMPGFSYLHCYIVLYTT